MACPTCDHTMQSIGDRIAIYWCPRCGTLKNSVQFDAKADVPKLVDRVIEFAGKLTEDHQDLIDEFERLGIRESITTIPPG